MKVSNKVSYTEREFRETETSMILYRQIRPLCRHLECKVRIRLLSMGQGVVEGINHSPECDKIYNKHMVKIMGGPND